MADNQDVVFSISTELEFRGRELKALKPDKDGIYKGIPLTVVGMKSRNNMVYETDSVMECLTDPKSRFVMNLKSGDLEGEWGHPLLSDEPKECVRRLLYLDRTRVSHHFTKIYAKKEKGTGYVIIYGDVKPSGPYAKQLDENFQDPTRNVSFSLRAATIVTRKDAGVTYKRMLAMFTFDAVDGPGYVEASKRFQDRASTEGLSLLPSTPECADIDINVSKEEFLKATASFKMAGQESKIVDQRVLDAFGCDEVTIREKILHPVKGGFFADRTGKKVSLFDTAFGD